MLATAGFLVVDRTGLADPGEAPDDWTDAVARVDELIEGRHGSDPRLTDVRGQELLSEGRIAGLLLRGRRTP